MKTASADLREALGEDALLALKRYGFISTKVFVQAMSLYPGRAFHYAWWSLGGKRFLEGEPVIASSPVFALRYAKDVLRTKWPEPTKARAEQSIRRLGPSKQQEYAALPEPAAQVHASAKTASSSLPVFPTRLRFTLQALHRSGFVTRAIRAAIAGNKRIAVTYCSDVKAPMPEAEPAIAQEAGLAVQYAGNVLHARFPAGEPAIAHRYLDQPAGGIYDGGPAYMATDYYCKHVARIEYPAPAGAVRTWAESVLAGKPSSLKTASSQLRLSWNAPELFETLARSGMDKRIKQAILDLKLNPYRLWGLVRNRWGYGQSRHQPQRLPWPEVERIFIDQYVRGPQDYALAYARFVIRSRWPEAEPLFAQNLEDIFWYANDCLGGRFPAGEPLVAKHLLAEDNDDRDFGQACRYWDKWIGDPAGIPRYEVNGAMSGWARTILAGRPGPRAYPPAPLGAGGQARQAGAPTARQRGLPLRRPGARGPLARGRTAAGPVRDSGRLARAALLHRRDQAGGAGALHAERPAPGLLEGRRRVGPGGAGRQAAARTAAATVHRSLLSPNTLTALRRGGMLSKPMVAAITQSPHFALIYANYVLEARFPAGEPAIARGNGIQLYGKYTLAKCDDNEAKLAFARMTAAKLLNPYDLVMLLKDMKATDPTEDLRARCMASLTGGLCFCLLYQEHLLPELDALLDRTDHDVNEQAALEYVRDVLQDRWPAFERYLARVHARNTVHAGIFARNYLSLAAVKHAIQHGATFEPAFVQAFLTDQYSETWSTYAAEYESAPLTGREIRDSHVFSARLAMQGYSPKPDLDPWVYPAYVFGNDRDFDARKRITNYLKKNHPGCVDDSGAGGYAHVEWGPTKAMSSAAAQAEGLTQEDFVKVFGARHIEDYQMRGFFPEVPVQASAKTASTGFSSFQAMGGIATLETLHRLGLVTGRIRAALAQDAVLSASYARYALEGRFPEGERAIAQAYLDPKQQRRVFYPCMFYVNNFLNKQGAEVMAWARAQLGGKTASSQIRRDFIYNPDRSQGLFSALTRAGFLSKRILAAVATNPTEAYRYACNFMKARWPEAEPAIAKDPSSAYHYAESVIKGQWPEAEPAIFTSPKYASTQALWVLKRPWPAAEPVIARGGDWGIGTYTKKLLHFGFQMERDVWVRENQAKAPVFAPPPERGRRPKQASSQLTGLHRYDMAHVLTALDRCGMVSKGLKAVLATSVRWAETFVQATGHAFPEGEAVIAREGWPAYWYTVNHLKRRWPEAEPALAQMVLDGGERYNRGQDYYRRYVREGELADRPPVSEVRSWARGVLKVKQVPRRRPTQAASV